MTDAETSRASRADGATIPSRGRLAVGDAVLLAVAVLGVSATGPLAAAAQAPALAIAFWRNAAASVVLVGGLAFRGGRRRAGSGSAARLSLLSGVFLAGHFAAWIPSLTMTSVAASTALVCAAPLWSGLIARVRGVRLGGRVWAGMALALGGVLLIGGADFRTSYTALAGDLLALVGALCMAAYLAVGERARRVVDTARYAGTSYAAAAVLLLLACLLSGSALFGYAARTWVLLAALTVCGQLVGHTLFNRSLRRLSGHTVATITLLEVPGAALIAAVWLGQAPSPAVAAGVVVVMLGVFVAIRGQRLRGGGRPPFSPSPPPK
ncbi:DMT family transporter [Streptomyces ferrugineus]|uniref:DMT family transporter n=1 Tax=Streptomyces ferrugineus TaxID=1413221 RepID=A0A7M2SWW7_9ACTN|nr:DMT family transporter [Streptomyces ferrugineus]QOV40782.1 DMT family transporter [Streptomyces ferrugineus]